MKKARSKIIVVLMGLLVVLLIPSFLVYGGSAKKIKQLEADLAASQKDKNALEQEKARLESQIESLNTRIGALEAEKSELEGRIAELESEIEEKDRRIEELEAEAPEPMVVAKTVEERLQAQDAEIIELKMEKRELEEELDELNRELEEVQAENSDLLAENESLAEENESLAEENESLMEENDSLRSELEGLEEGRSDYAVQIEELEAEIDELEAQIEELEAEKEDLEAALALYEGIEVKSQELKYLALERLQELLADEIEEGTVRIFEGAIGIVVDVISESMFNVGSVEINPSGKTILGKISELFAELDEYMIGVIGNADNKRIVTPALKKRFGTNWELSAHRGAVVVRYIIEKGGISPERMVAMGFGEFQPVDDNTTQEGRDNNRRIDIVFLPIDVMSAVLLGTEVR